MCVVRREGIYINADESVLRELGKYLKRFYIGTV